MMINEEKSHFVKQLNEVDLRNQLIKFIKNAHKICKIISKNRPSYQKVLNSKDVEINEEEIKLIQDLSLAEKDNDRCLLNLIKFLEFRETVDFRVHIYGLDLFSRIISILDKAGLKLKEARNQLYLCCFIISQKVLVDSSTKTERFAKLFQLDSKKLVQLEFLILNKILDFDVRINNEKNFEEPYFLLKNMKKLIKDYKDWYDQRVRISPHKDYINAKNIDYRS